MYLFLSLCCIFLHVCVTVCVYIYIYIYIHVFTCVHVYMRICLFFLYLYIYIYIYIYVYTYILFLEFLSPYLFHKQGASKLFCCELHSSTLRGTVSQVCLLESRAEKPKSLPNAAFQSRINLFRL